MKLSKPQRNFFTCLITGLICFGIFLSCSEAPESNTNELPADSTISQTIQNQLVKAADVPAKEIDIDVENGIVRISGSTTNLLAKKRATEIAEASDGVISVVNNLKVTVSRPDEAVNNGVDQALSTDPATENWEIATKVNNGMVTLTGAVDSWQEKNLATAVVSGIKGVKEVNNNIIVEDNEDRSDSDIKAEVESSLMFDSRIKDNMINIKVDSGIVTLEGSVGSATEKKLAIQKSYVQGVEKIEADNLEVHPEYDSKMFVNQMISTLTPSQIENAIQNALKYDPRVPSDQISVSVNSGTAILSGTVRNLNSKMSATEDAQNTAGVSEVENNITVERKVIVKPEIPTTDKAIQSRIINSIHRDPYVEEVQINAEVEKGMVILKGTVNSEFEKKRIEELAQNVKGVINITNKLSVKSKNVSS